MTAELLERVLQRLAVGGALPTAALVADAVRTEAGGVLGQTDRDRTGAVVADGVSA